MGYKSVSLIVLLLAGIVLAFWFKTSYVEFQPIVFNGQSYTTLEDEPGFYKSLARVLRYYNLDYKIEEDGRLLVKRYVVGDKELIMNYTHKALDTAWCRVH